jgi:hypothetical protein
MLSVVIAVLYRQALAAGILNSLTRYWARREKPKVVPCKVKAQPNTK